MFKIDGSFFSAVSKVGDLVLLNILFLLCCIPVITIGASVSAMYAVTKKMVKNEESYIISGFLKQFKNNFRNSTIIWIILLAISVILSIDMYVISLMDKGIIKGFFTVFIVMSFIIVVFVTIYSLTLQCTFENTIKNTFKNAVLISIGHLPWSILMGALTVSPIICLLCFGQFLGMIFLTILVIWFSGVAYINSFILNRIYKKYM